MIVLDTNVVSEIMRPVSNPHVVVWFDSQHPQEMFLTSTSLAELLSGIAAMPSGSRQSGMFDTLHKLRTRYINPRILPFDEASAEMYGLLTSLAKKNGRAISVADWQIAAIAKVNGYAVGTRDTSPFEAAGVAVINPWDGA
jgi:predicted nucleic acid-binding protein